MVFIGVTLFIIGLIGAEPLTLDDCVEMALRENLILKQAEEALSVANADYWSSWSNFLPNLTLSSGYSRSKSEYPWPGGYYSFEDTSYSANLQLTQTLFDVGTIAYVSELRANRQMVATEYEKKRLAILLEVKEDYYSVLRTEKLLEVSRTSLRESETNLQKTEQMHALGSASRAGLLRAQVNLLESRLELMTAEKNVKLAKSKLAITLGFSSSEDLSVQEDPSPKLEEIPPYERLLELAGIHSPELRKAGANLGLAKTGLYASYGRFLPGLSLSASYGWESDYLLPLQDAWDTGRKSWRVALNLSLPIFTGFQRALTVSKARAELRNAEHYREISERNLALELKSCYLDAKESQEMLELARESLELARESYEAARERYNLGAAPILELIDAELSLVKAESIRIQAFYDYILGVERLKTIVGKEDL
jgi:outer membrane protein